MQYDEHYCQNSQVTRRTWSPSKGMCVNIFILFTWTVQWFSGQISAADAKATKTSLRCSCVEVIDTDCFGGVHAAHLFSCLCYVLCFVCICSVFCTQFVYFSGLSILIDPSVFYNVYFEIQQNNSLITVSLCQPFR